MWQFISRWQIELKLELSRHIKVLFFIIIISSINLQQAFHMLVETKENKQKRLEGKPGGSFHSGSHGYVLPYLKVNIDTATQC